MLLIRILRSRALTKDALAYSAGRCSNRPDHENAKDSEPHASHHGALPTSEFLCIRILFRNVTVPLPCRWPASMKVLLLKHVQTEEVFQNVLRGSDLGHFVPLPFCISGESVHPGLVPTFKGKKPPSI
jgi:hypothetical protein